MSINAFNAFSWDKKSPLELINIEGHELFIKRDDLLAPSLGDPLCGNKWRKLKYNLKEAIESGHNTLLTFGGAYSNHIAAVASAGRHFKLNTIGIIRGEAHVPLNPTLELARQYGMRLEYMNRSDYRAKKEPVILERLQGQFGDYYLIPEGGTNQLAVKGAADLVAELSEQLEGRIPDYVVVSCGTGGTVAGIINGLKGESQVIGVAALKGNFLQKEVEKYLLQPYQNWSILNEYHFGGYAKFTPPLIEFIKQFKKNHQIQLDPIYTGKTFYALMDLVRKRYFSTGSLVVVVHTGGLQGIEGFQQRNQVQIE